LNRGVSIWLDVLRVGATLVVLLSHWAYPRFTDGRYGFLRDWNVGSDAVVMFFVISGCVIAYAAQRDAGAGPFAFNRLTRLWSVMLPALVLSFVFDIIGYGIDPTAYPSTFYQPLGLSEYMARGISFSNEWGAFGRLRLGTNGPLWSLSYEAAYYLLFGIVMFTHGVRRIALVVFALLLAGLDIILLMPAWLMGVALWHWLKTHGTTGLSARFAWLMALAGPGLYVMCHVVGVPEMLAGMTANWLGVDHAGRVFGFSDEFLWNFLIGVFTVMHIIGMSVVFQGKARGYQGVRWLAGASFSIYVVHYPTLHLLDAILPDHMGRDVALLGGAFVIGLAFASVFERPIGKLRARLELIVQRFSNDGLTRSQAQG